MKTYAMNLREYLKQVLFLYHGSILTYTWSGRGLDRAVTRIAYLSRHGALECDLSSADVLVLDFSYQGTVQISLLTEVATHYERDGGTSGIEMDGLIGKERLKISTYSGLPIEIKI